VTVGEEWILFKESHDSWSPPRTQTGVGFVPTKIRTPEADHTHGYSPCGSGLSYPNRRHPHWLAQTIWIEIHSAAVNLSDRLITTFPMVLLRLRYRGIKTISHVAADRDLVKGICCNHPGGGASALPCGVVPQRQMLLHMTSFLQYFYFIFGDFLTLLRVAGGMLAHPFFQAVPIKNVWL
jgi:hypothetical protein